MRYKSHHSLHVKERFVNVYRLFLCNKDSKPLFDKVNKKNIDYVSLNNEIRADVKKQQELLRMKDETYLPTVKLLKTLKIGDSEKLYIPMESEYGMISQGYHKKKIRGLIRVGWDAYNDLKHDNDRKMWRVKLYSEWFINYSPDRDIPIQIMGTIYLRLYILCQAKLANNDIHVIF